MSDFTKQFLTVIKFRAAVRLEFRSCRRNIGRYNGTWVVLFVIVSVLGAFAVLRKTTVSSIAVRPSVLKEQLGTHCTDCHEIW